MSLISDVYYNFLYKLKGNINDLRRYYKTLGKFYLQSIIVFLFMIIMGFEFINTLIDKTFIITNFDVIKNLILITIILFLVLDENVLLITIIHPDNVYLIKNKKLYMINLISKLIFVNISMISIMITISYIISIYIGNIGIITLISELFVVLILCNIKFVLFNNKKSTKTKILLILICTLYIKYSNIYLATMLYIFSLILLINRCYNLNYEKLYPIYKMMYEIKESIKIDDMGEMMRVSSEYRKNNHIKSNNYLKHIDLMSVHESMIFLYKDLKILFKDNNASNLMYVIVIGIFAFISYKYKHALCISFIISYYMTYSHTNHILKENYKVMFNKNIFNMSKNKYIIQSNLLLLIIYLMINSLLFLGNDISLYNMILVILISGYLILDMNHKILTNKSIIVSDIILTILVISTSINIIMIKVMTLLVLIYITHNRYKNISSLINKYLQ